MHNRPPETDEIIHRVLPAEYAPTLDSEPSITR